MDYSYVAGIFRLYADFAPMILRVVLGAAFIAHGYPKLFKAREQTAQWFDAVGIAPGKFWALAVGAVEFFGGIALVFGAFVEIAGLLIAAVMLVAAWKVKWGRVGYVSEGGWELDAIYFAAAVSFVFTGPGAFALSSVIGL